MKGQIRNTTSLIFISKILPNSFRVSTYIYILKFVFFASLSRKPQTDKWQNQQNPRVLLVRVCRGKLVYSICICKLSYRCSSCTGNWMLVENIEFWGFRGNVIGTIIIYIWQKLLKTLQNKLMTFLIDSPYSGWPSWLSIILTIVIVSFLFRPNMVIHVCDESKNCESNKYNNYSLFYFLYK